MQIKKRLKVCKGKNKKGEAIVEEKDKGVEKRRKKTEKKP